MLKANVDLSVKELEKLRQGLHELKRATLDQWARLALTDEKIQEMMNNELSYIRMLEVKLLEIEEETSK